MTSSDPPALQRWRLDLSYDGTDFSGWAAQPGRRTVQGELERWIPQVLRLRDPVQVLCAGRTDAGVHARGQVAHLDLPLRPGGDGTVLLRRLGRVLPPDIFVRSVSRAPDHFDARFGAVWRRYSYRMMDAGARVDPLMRHQVTLISEAVDLERMNAGGAMLVGLRDFGAFCRRREGATTIRTLLELSARRVTHGPLADTIEVTVRADAFCHSMVRSLVGALVAVGSGRRSLDWLSAVQQAAVRDSGVPVLAARGLTLEEVRYPPDDQLRSRSVTARSARAVAHG